MGSIRTSPTPMLDFEKTTVYHVENVDEPELGDSQFTLAFDEAVPTDFRPYYDKAHFETGSYLTERGRPEFTDRNLVDWELNDNRSLLIFHQLPEGWPCLPRIIQKEYQAYLLPTNAGKAQAATILADSNLYIESNIDRDVKLQIARSSVDAAYAEANTTTLSLTQWRHMIENYLLNLACEVQVRLDYKRALRQLKRNKFYLSPGSSIRISQEERAGVFQKVQATLYRRLGLNWDVDPID
ncbi:Protein STD1 [Wickerhamiella sorbophila]|uniref:Protein STD1 n=1 Tax=Wickerhamiella sorbophila TaxID=45607 RepID=A0A2T0FJS2_9ASCO|nr:Protein STD1 [Wickerhamiella sorbophila]PRT55232.1 Protein STD1 [Wickerhamiella sorbophila]